VNNKLGLLCKELRQKSDPIKAKLLKRYFKTGKGEYGEGDIFLGITVPEQRKISGKYVNLGLKDIEKLLQSKIHEFRFSALAILCEKYKKSDEQEKKAIVGFYLKNKEYINNWDLVDMSAHCILGDYLSGKNREILYKLIRSKNIWDRRIAILATFNFIKNNDFKGSIKIAEELLNDKHDLIHKATGWMLREVGKRNKKTEEKFLQKHCGKMPRTMLRYAIELFPANERKKYLANKQTNK